jgi:hypothetical protein
MVVFQFNDCSVAVVPGMAEKDKLAGVTTNGIAVTVKVTGIEVTAPA